MKISFILLFMTFISICHAQNEIKDSTGFGFDFGVNAIISQPSVNIINQFGQRRNWNVGLSANFGFAPVKYKFFLINFDFGFSELAGRYLKNTTYVTYNNTAVPVQGEISQLFNWSNISLYYAFKIAPKNLRTVFFIGPVIRAGYTVFFSDYAISDPLYPGGETTLLTKRLITTDAFNVAPGLEFRYSFFGRLMYAKFQVLYNFNTKVKLINYGLEQEPSIGFVNIRTSEHPNAYIDNVGEVYEKNINMLQFNIGFGFNFGKIKKRS